MNFLVFAVGIAVFGLIQAQCPPTAPILEGRKYSIRYFKKSCLPHLELFQHVSVTSVRLVSALAIHAVSSFDCIIFVRIVIVRTEMKLSKLRVIFVYITSSIHFYSGSGGFPTTTSTTTTTTRTTTTIGGIATPTVK